MKNAGQSQPRKGKTWADRMKMYEEQRQQRLASGEKKGTGPKGPGKKQRREPPEKVIRCQIYFWQKVANGPIQIGHVPLWSVEEFRTMQGAGAERANLLAVIEFASIPQLEGVRQQFAYLTSEGEWFQPDPKLLAFIELHGKRWEAPRPIRPAKSELYWKEPTPPKAALETRKCERCQVQYETCAKDKYCKTCRKVVKEELYAAGYWQYVPRPTTTKPENIGAARLNGDPSPWLENAVRSLEDGD